MMPMSEMNKGVWYWGVLNEKVCIAQWMGSAFAMIKEDRMQYFNHVSEIETGFEPLEEVRMIGSGQVWAIRNHNKLIYG